MKYILLFFFCIFFIYTQTENKPIIKKKEKKEKKNNSKNVKIKKNKIQNFQLDYLVNKVRVDIEKKVSKNMINDRIAIVELSHSDSISFDSYAFSYLMVSLESLRFSNDKVDFVRSIDALSLRGYELDDKLIIKRGVVSNDEMKRFVNDLGAKYYARISLFLKDGYLLLVLSVYDIKDHSLVYKSSYANYYKDWTLSVSYSSYFGDGFSQFIPGASVFIKKNILNTIEVGLGSGIYFLSSPFRISSFSIFLELDFPVLNYLGIYVRGFDLATVLNFETQFLFVETKDKLFFGGGIRLGILDFLNIIILINYNFIEVLNIQPEESVFGLESSSSDNNKLEFKLNTGMNIRF